MTESRYGADVTLVDDAQWPTIDVIIVTHNGEALISDTLRSLCASSGVSIRSFVVDSGSTDTTVARASLIANHVIALQNNVGYGEACNVGIHAASSPWILVCNQDVIFEPTALHNLITTAVAEENRCGRPAIIAPTLLTSGGRQAEQGHAFPTLLGTVILLLTGESRVHFRDVRRLNSGAVHCDWVSGACLMGRRQVFTQIGGFDPKYFMYVEDLDIFSRLNAVGGHCVLDSTSNVVHLGGARPIPAHLYAITLSNWAMYWGDRAGTFAHTIVRAAGAMGAVLRSMKWLCLAVLSRPDAGRYAVMFARGGLLSLLHRNTLLRAAKENLR